MRAPTKVITREFLTQNNLETFIWGKVEVARKGDRLLGEADFDSCWPWRGSVNKDYRARLQINGIGYYAYRLTYVLFFNEDLPDGMLLHSCGNQTCCNPMHVYLGSYSQNMADKIAHGRLRIARGEDHYNTELSWAFAEHVRDLHRQGWENQTALAEHLGVNRTVVHHIINGKTWIRKTEPELPPPPGPTVSIGNYMNARQLGRFLSYLHIPREGNSIAGAALADRCWQWTGSPTAEGYGQFSGAGRDKLAHRIAYRVFTGSPAPELLQHKCHNPLCCNPLSAAHVVPGDKRGNWQDEADRGRVLLPPHHSGSSHPRAKLSDEEVLEIYDLYSTGKFSIVQLSDKYGVSRFAVRRITRCEGWEHVLQGHVPLKPTKPLPIGNAHSRAIFTEAEVRDIRHRVDNGLATVSELAREYNRPRPTVDAIAKRISWKHIE